MPKNASRKSQAAQAFPPHILLAVLLCQMLMSQTSSESLPAMCPPPQFVAAA